MVPSGQNTAHLPIPLPSHLFQVSHIYLQREVLLNPVTSPLTAPLGSILPPSLSGTNPMMKHPSPLIAFLTPDLTWTA